MTRQNLTSNTQLTFYHNYVNYTGSYTTFKDFVILDNITYKLNYSATTRNYQKSKLFLFFKTYFN